MSTVDEETLATIERYRTEFEQVSGGAANDQGLLSYRETADALLYHVAQFGRLAWAVEHPLHPIAAYILCEAGQEDSDDLMAELRRTGEAILVAGEPNRLRVVQTRTEQEQEEEVALGAIHRDKKIREDLTLAWHWANALKARLRLVEMPQRREVLRQLVDQLL